MDYSDFLDPSCIAVYGASETPSSPATHIFRNLISQGFQGQVAAINPKYDTVARRPCHPSQTAGGIAAELAVLAIPASAVPTALQDCASVGTRAAIVITAGFDESAGPAGKTRLCETAEHAGIRFVGPNCLGLIRPHTNLNATFQPAMPPTGGLALISQSGAICSGLADMAAQEGLGFSFMLSMGNSLNFGLADALDMAAEDDQTETVLAYIEGVRDGPRFLAALKRTCEKKPVIVLKAGRYAQGAEAAMTHTGALVGSDTVFSAALKGCGAIQVATLGGLIETARLLNAAPVLDGDRLAIVTNGGGVGVLSADRLADRGLRPAELPEDAVQKLDSVLSKNWSRRNPIDIVGDATADHYKAALDACLEKGSFDAVLALLSPQSMTSPETVADVVLGAHHASSKPIMTCFLGGQAVASARAKLRREGVPDFDLPEDAVQAFAASLRAMEPSRKTQSGSLITGPTTDHLKRDHLGVENLPNGVLSDVASRRLLVSAGIPCPVPEKAASAEEAVAIFERLNGPVVLKVASPDISHKSDVDGVRLNLTSQTEVADAFTGIQERARERRPNAVLQGVTVEPMVNLPHARELLVGLTRDPVFGPVLTFGAGGTLVELLDDVATALLPVTLDQARQVISETKIAKLLGPYRNMPPVDEDELARLLVAVSDLAMVMPELAEMDINPLFASPAGLCAVDARVRIEREDPALVTTDAD